MSVDIECVVVGAGVVGLAVARALARSGRDVILVEAGEGIGVGISSRNSEVIHAGIYYPSGRLKAQVCVEGKQRLYAYCDERGVDYRRLGKLIVATMTVSARPCARCWRRAGAMASMTCNGWTPNRRGNLNRQCPASLRSGRRPPGSSIPMP